METNVLFKSIVEEVENIFPPDIRETLNIEVREVVKHNDNVLHGLTINRPDSMISPMMYLEDCIPSFEEGRSIQEIAMNVVNGYFEAIENAPSIPDIPTEFDDIKGRLVLDVADAQLNKSRLKDGVYKSIGNGMVVVPYVIISDGPDGTCRYMITKDIAKSEKYDLDMIFKAAMENTLKNNPPQLESMMAKVLLPILDGNSGANPMSNDFCLPEDNMYVLSNESGHHGAIALFYPGMQERLGELIGKSYYVIPSSTHETILVPDNGDISHKNLIDMLKDANENLVAPEERLSNRVFKYDIERKRMYEPAAQERAGDERSIR